MPHFSAAKRRWREAALARGVVVTERLGCLGIHFWDKPKKDIETNDRKQ
jgi:hypothetical protein